MKKTLLTGVITILLVSMGCKQKTSMGAQPSVKEDNATAVNAHGGRTEKEVIELFCSSQFIGDVSTARYDYSKVSSNYKVIEDKTTGNAPPMIETDPVVIVATYTISDIETNGDSAVVNVIFEKLGYGSEYINQPDANIKQRTIIPDYKESDLVSYTLKRIDNKWYVYDPPIMRVSLAAINKSYFEQATSFLPNDFWIDVKFSNSQRRNIAQQFSDMEVIMKISADYLKKLETRYKYLGGPEHPDIERQKKVRILYTGKWKVEIVSEDKNGRRS